MPTEGLYGAQTQRAVDNFPVSGMTMPAVFIRALAMIKGAAAEVNHELGLLDGALAEAVALAAAEVAVGLALILSLFRKRDTINLEDLNLMKW